MEGEHAEAFAQADEQLITSLRFIEIAGRPEKDLADSSQSVLEIALKPTDAATADVQSASDLR